MSVRVSTAGLPAPARLERLRWKGEATYRVLSYYFEVRWNWVDAGRYVSRVLDRFAVEPDPDEQRTPPTPGMPPRYSIVRVGKGSDRRYQLFYADELMVSSARRNVPLEHFVWNVNSETIRRTGDFLLIHSGALATQSGEGVLIVGPSGSGKSTLTAAAVRAGFDYLSDEAAAIDPVSRLLHPYAKPITLKAGRPSAVADGLGGRGNGLVPGQWHVMPEELRPECVSGPCRIRYVLAHRYEEGGSTALVPITRAAGLVELCRNALNLPTYRDRGMALLADVAREASHYRLTSGSVEDALRALADVTGSVLVPYGDGAPLP